MVSITSFSSVVTPSGTRGQTCTPASCFIPGSICRHCPDCRSRAPLAVSLTPGLPPLPARVRAPVQSSCSHRRSRRNSRASRWPLACSNERRCRARLGGGRDGNGHRVEPVHGGDPGPRALCRPRSPQRRIPAARWARGASQSSSSAQGIRLARSRRSWRRQVHRSPSPCDPVRAWCLGTCSECRFSIWPSPSAASHGMCSSPSPLGSRAPRCSRAARRSFLRHRRRDAPTCR